MAIQNFEIVKVRKQGTKKIATIPAQSKIDFGEYIMIRKLEVVKS